MYSYCYGKNDCVQRQKKDSKEESDNNSSDEEVDANSSSGNRDNIQADVEFKDNSEDDDYDIESKGSKKRRNSAKSSTRKLKDPNDDEGTVKVASNKRDATLKPIMANCCLLFSFMSLFLADSE